MTGKYYLATIDVGCKAVEYCGREEYNPNEMKCCSMTKEGPYGAITMPVQFFTIHIDEQCPALMCGRVEYDAEKEQCCEGDFVMSAEKPCPRPAYCRDEIYNTNTHKCCEE